MLKSSINPMALPKTRSTSASLGCSGVRADRSAISSDMRPILPLWTLRAIIGTLANSHEDPPLGDPLNLRECGLDELRRIYLLNISVNKLVDLAQSSGLHLVDEAVHAVVMRDERTRLDTCHRLAHIFLQVREGLHGEVRLHANLFVDLGFELVV